MAKKRSPTRSVRLLRPPDSAGVGIISLSVGAKEVLYEFKEIPCDIGGRAFAVYRLDLGELYYVRVGQPEECSCECKGFLRHGNCKHIKGLKALTEKKLV